MTVIKRDGKRVEFDVKKIERVINLANKSVPAEKRIDDETVTSIASKVVQKIGHRDTVEVEEIQDLVEQNLLQNKKAYFIGKEFLRVRDERAKERFMRLDVMKEIKRKLEASDVQNQNANVDEHSFGGRKGEADGELMKKLALDYYIQSKRAVKNHLENRIYIHDLDNYVVGMHNCLSIPFDYLLKYGFNTRQTDIRPASSINTAFQLVAVIFQLQSLQQFGGVSATHLDWTMVPYVRISFWKHFKELLNAYNIFNEGENFDPIEMPVAREDAMNISIDSKLYKFNKKIYDMALAATEKETLQAVEGMYHNLNTLQSRSGNQLPFTSINYGTCTLPEGRMVIKALLEASLDGVGKLHKTPIFPCGIFQKKKGINDKGSKNYDLYKLAIKSTSKRLYPNYANCDWSGNDDTKSYELKKKFVAGLTDEQKSKLIESIRANNLVDVLGLTENLESVKDSPLAMFSTMGCRTANGFDINWYDSWVEEVNNVIAGNLPTSNFLATGQQKDGRGNICPATIILPTLAMEAKKKAKNNPEYIVDYFMDILEKAIGDCKDELIERFNWISIQSPASAKFMYENGTMYGYKESEGIRSALKHGTLAIGQLGLAETLQILVGCDQTEEKGMALAKQIEQLFKDKCAEYKEHYKLNFGVYLTPAENLCFTAFKKFKKKYGEIKNVTYSDIEGKEDSDVKDHREFFTNSMHVPVWKKMDPFEKIDIESQLTGYSSAGCITYVELDDRTQNNLKALEQIVDYAMEKDIPYFAINVPADTCTCCGYQGSIDNECPVCGARDTPGKKVIQRLRRVTGYLTGDFETAFNLGKQDEVKHRYKHSESLVDWNNTSDQEA